MIPTIIFAIISLCMLFDITFYLSKPSTKDKDSVVVSTFPHHGYCIRYDGKRFYHDITDQEKYNRYISTTFVNFCKDVEKKKEE